MALSYQTAGLMVASVGILLCGSLVLRVGRWLERRWGFGLGWGYRVGALIWSVYGPLSAYNRWVWRADSGAFWSSFLSGRASLEAPWVFPEPVLDALRAAGVMLAAGVVAGVVRRHFWEGWVMRKRGKRVPRLLVDLSGVVLVGGALVYVAESVYGADLSALKLGSTVSVAVLGFASQDLLGNLLSGMALQMASPFKAGDWLLLDGRRLQVVEVNWRATRMRSPENILVEVPNKTVAGGVITNLSAPTEERATTVGVVVESGAAPREVKACLAEAASRVEGVMAEPPVRVNVKEFLEAGVSYEVVFWVRGEEVLGEVSDAVRVAVWYGLREGGFRMAYPGRRLWIEGGAGGLGMQEGRLRKE